MLRPLIDGRLKLPADGRGTDRGEGAAKGMLPPERAPGLLDGDIDLTPPCGGRGMSRFIAICGGCWRVGVAFAGRPNDLLADGGRGTLRLVMTGLLGARFEIGPALGLIRFSGGRGTDRPASEGVEFVIVGRLLGITLLRAAGLPRVRPVG